MDLATIQRRITMVDDLEQEVKVAKDALKQELQGNDLYVEADKAAKETANKKGKIKSEIMSRAENQKLLDDVRANNEEVTTLKEILSAELMEYFQETKTDEIPGADGSMRKYKMIAKLFPKNDR